MKSTSLVHPIGIAFLLTGLAALNELLLSQWLSGVSNARLNLSIILLLYVGFLIRQNRLRAGAITLMAFDLGVIVICLLAETRLSTLLWLYPVIMWLNRSLLRYSGFVPVFVDLGLCLLGIGAVLWAVNNDHGVTTALWCFLLLQALHILIPCKTVRYDAKPAPPADDNFDRALQSAENALQQLLRSR